jgi:predicted nucleotide-binding protein
MAKRQEAEPPIESKKFNSVDEIDRAIEKLRRRIYEVEELKSNAARHNAPEVNTVVSNIRKTILDTFGQNSPEFLERGYHEISYSITPLVQPNHEQLQRVFEAGFPHTLGMLQGLVKRLEEDRLDFAPVQPETKMKNTGHIFMGHGHSLEWLKLQTFLKDRLHLQCVEFNTEPAAGVGTQERLSELLNQAIFAFLVLTAEDEQTDGSKHARENVVHEAGLFQGRHGFRKAIVVLEGGCVEFSNIHGLGQIRFQKGQIESCYEEVRKVLEREKILKSNQQ